MHCKLFKDKAVWRSKGTLGPIYSLLADIPMTTAPQLFSVKKVIHVFRSLIFNRSEKDEKKYILPLLFLFMKQIATESIKSFS